MISALGKFDEFPVEPQVENKDDVFRVFIYKKIALMIPGLIRRGQMFSSFTSMQTLMLQKKKQTEEKAKVVAAVLGTNLNAALAIQQQG